MPSFKAYFAIIFSAQSQQYFTRYSIYRYSCTPMKYWSSTSGKMSIIFVSMITRTHLLTQNNFNRIMDK